MTISGFRQRGTLHLASRAAARFCKQLQERQENSKPLAQTNRSCADRFLRFVWTGEVLVILLAVPY